MLVLCVVWQGTARAVVDLVGGRVECGLHLLLCRLLGLQDCVVVQR